MPSDPVRRREQHKAAVERLTRQRAALEAQLERKQRQIEIVEELLVEAWKKERKEVRRYAN